MDYTKLKELAEKARKIEDRIWFIEDPESALVMSVTDAVTSSHVVNVVDSSELRSAIIGSLNTELSDVNTEIKSLTA